MFFDLLQAGKSEQHEKKFVLSMLFGTPEVRRNGDIPLYYFNKHSTTIRFFLLYTYTQGYRGYRTW